MGAVQIHGAGQGRKPGQTRAGLGGRRHPNSLKPLCQHPLYSTLLRQRVRACRSDARGSLQPHGMCVCVCVCVCIHIHLYIYSPSTSGMCVSTPRYMNTEGSTPRYVCVDPTVRALFPLYAHKQGFGAGQPTVCVCGVCLVCVVCVCVSTPG